MAPPKLHAEKRRSFAIYGNNNSRLKSGAKWQRIINATNYGAIVG